MMKVATLAFAAATILSASAASAQVIDLGRGGPQIDLRNQNQRERDFQREQSRRDAESYRRTERGGYDRGGYDRRDLSTGSVRGRCREVTVREQDSYGRTVTRKTRDCD